MAVYTTISDNELCEFLLQYDIGTLVTYKGIAEGVENTNFLLETTKGHYILTIYEKRVQTDELPYYLELMQHLSAKGFPSPIPLKTKNGKMLQQLKQRPAAIVSFLQGKGTHNIKNHHLDELGKFMAKMHNEAEDFPMQLPNNFSLSSWKKMAEDIGTKANDVKEGLANEIQQQLDTLSTNWPDALPTGVIHADLFPDNVFFQKNYLSGIIDFYFACNDFLSYDLAICLNAWCFEPHGEFNITKARKLISSYNKVRPLTQEELNALPILASGAAMRFLLTRLYDWINRVDGAIVTPKNPLEYLQKLRFHQGISGPEAYGIYEGTLNVTAC